MCIRDRCSCVPPSHPLALALPQVGSMHSMNEQYGSRGIDPYQVQVPTPTPCPRPACARPITHVADG
eukprot:2359832-Rhodomonas_salina.1